LELYLQVVALQHEQQKQQGDMELDREKIKYQFRALENIVKLCTSLQKYESMVQHFQQMLPLLPHVTRNECTDSINGILDVVSQAEDPSMISTMYEITLNALKTANNDRLWFQTNVKLGKLYLDIGDYTQLRRVVNELHQSCKTPDGLDDLSKATSLLDVYCLEIQVTSEPLKLKLCCAIRFLSMTLLCSYVQLRTIMLR